MKYCGCGCGETIKGKGNFIPGHDAKLKSKLLQQWRKDRNYRALEELRNRNWLNNTKDNRTFGIEIECRVSGNTLSEAQIKVKDAIRRQGLEADVEGYNHSTRDYWKVIYDASIDFSRGWQGIEIVSPVLKGDEGRKQVELVCKALEEVGAKVNKSCGLHIHHGANDLKLNDFKNLAFLYMVKEDEVDQMVAKSRRKNNNGFCRSLNSYYNVFQIKNARSVKQLIKLAGSTRAPRYSKINFSAYVRHGTVEFRQHQGTVEAKKILAWLDFGQQMIRTAKNLTKAHGNNFLIPDEINLEDLVEMDYQQIEYWRNRKQKLDNVGVAA